MEDFGYLGVRSKKNRDAETNASIFFKDRMKDANLTFYEFFAGGGMARIGLGSNWRCIFANEWRPKKADSYKKNHSVNGELVVEDVAKLGVKDIPGKALLSWASFPCQDLSLAGNGRGLKGKRSGTFWPFWNLMADLSNEGRKIPIIVLENVVGAMTSNHGKDFQAIANAMIAKGYIFGPLVINAAYFLPQSRPRLFIVAVDSKVEIDASLLAKKPIPLWHPKQITKAYDILKENVKSSWRWWNLPMVSKKEYNLMDIIENDAKNVRWHAKSETDKLLNMMSPPNLKKVYDAQDLNRPIAGTIYKRTRPDGNGGTVQRAEVRFDQIGGCLRTPAGGSSRQIIIVVNGNEIRTRLISPREAARLMGLEDTYILPENYNEAYHLLGDGLVTPVVSWLEKHLLYPLAKSILSQEIE